TRLCCRHSDGGVGATRRSVACCRKGHAARHPSPVHPTIQRGYVEACQASATIFMHQGFVSIAPTKQPSFVNRMNRVDRYMGATKRNPSRDATVAEHRNDVSFRSAG